MIGWLFRGLVLQTLMRILGFVIFCGVCLLLGWRALAPKSPELHSERQQVGLAAVAKTAEALREARGKLRLVAVMPLANDSSGFFTEELRARLDASGILDVEAPPLSERLRRYLGQKVRGEFDASKSLAYGREQKLDGVIIGRLDRFEAMPKGAVLVGEVQLLEVATGKAIAVIALKEDTTPQAAEAPAASAAAAPPPGKGGGMPWHLRVLGFLLVMLMLPVVTIAFLRQMVARKSNRVNAFCLGIYTLADAILAFFLLGGILAGGWMAALLAAAVVVAFCYNVSLMTFALRLES